MCGMLGLACGQEAACSAEPGKEILVRIVSMLVGLIRSTSPDRAHEQGAVYESKRRGLGD
jgi:hypothetical protein